MAEGLENRRRGMEFQHFRESRRDSGGEGGSLA